MQADLRKAPMKKENETDHRSGCPINLTLEVVGDKWSLLIIRDIMFGNRRHFRELLTRSEERIASNILADRLKRLVEQGIITKAEDPTHRLQNRDLMRLVTRGLNRNERLIIILYYYEDMTMKEIGATLDLSYGRSS